ncbi:tyrosine-type recombinase/integrase [Hyphococcus sp. DH-69]|uniref:tyrosine-type recombinase/integrase n=1 Tax=Hyphococcus formosus TaxID=3143534 RepID=UPI00398AB101
MLKINSKNERIKRKYLNWLEDARRKDVKTTTQVAAAISLFEQSTGNRDFTAFHFEQARKFKRDLEKATNEKTGKPLSETTIRSRLQILKAFIEWLSDQPGYKSKVDFTDAAYFSPSGRQDRIAAASREKPFPSLAQIRHVITTAPDETSIEKRDRALIAFAILTGMRDAALASLPVGKVNMARREVFQDARVVNTKNSKTMKTFFFPVGDDFVKIIEEWVAYLKTELLFAETDPLFPKTETGLNEDGVFAALGLTREYWTDASAIRRIFRERFEVSGLSYFHPHSFRKTLAHLAYDLNLGLRDSKAWSQNLGHEKADTTWTSYGTLPDHQTGEIMAGLMDKKTAPSESPPPEALEWMKRQVERGQ